MKCSYVYTAIFHTIVDIVEALLAVKQFGFVGLDYVL